RRSAAPPADSAGTDEAAQRREHEPSTTWTRRRSGRGGRRRRAAGRTRAAGRRTRRSESAACPLTCADGSPSPTPPRAAVGAERLLEQPVLLFDPRLARRALRAAERLDVRVVLAGFLAGHGPDQAALAHD